jgi:2,4-dienoyl-CoA reductase-like NADH-dependent reductase (Old Yellow Enzyme family)
MLLTLRETIMTSPKLFSPIQLGHQTLPNRIMISPMCQYSAHDGNATDWHLTHLGSLAISGAALLCVEATAVSAEARITHGCLGLYNDANQAALKKTVDAIRSIAPVQLAIQLSHEFLSPLANQRTDAYGGSLENRMRLPLQVFEAVRAAAGPDIAVGARLSATDWVEGGWDVAQSIELAKKLQALGADFLDISSGGVSPLQKITLAPGYQVPLAAQIKQAVSLPVITVGLITEPAHAEQILQDGQADMVAVARAFLSDPRWPWRAAAALGGTIAAPQQFYRCLPAGSPAIFGAIHTAQR